VRSSRTAEALAAAGLLTRIPLGRLLPAPDAVDYAASVWAYPLVGAVVGSVAAAVYALATGLGMSPVLASVWALVASGLMTGALHEDGLADAADGLGGGRTMERRLAIMRDSRIGTYGALALVLAVGMRVAAIAALGAPGVVAGALISSGMLGRSAMVLVMYRGEPARRDGLAAALGRIGSGPAWAAIGFAAVGSVLLVGFGDAVMAVVVTGLIGLWWGGVGRRAIGGHTGDMLGAVEIMVECVVLSLLSAVVG